MLRVFYIGGSDEKFLDILNTERPRILEAIRKRLDIIDAKLQRKIQGEKLQGQVLHQRSGKLINSIRIVKAEIVGDKVMGGVEGAGGPAWYGAIHEQMPGSEFASPRAYEIVPVNKKALAFMMNGKQVIVKRVHHPAAAERSFMRSAYKEMEGQIMAELEEALQQLAKE